MARRGEACTGGAHVIEPEQAKALVLSSSQSWSAVSSLQCEARPGEVCTGRAHVIEPEQAAATQRQPPAEQLTISARHEQRATRGQALCSL